MPLLVLCTLLLAQQPPATLPTGTARIIGIVRDTEGRPVPRATITRQGPQSSNGLSVTLTADDGTFAFEGLAASRHRLTASKTGFVQTQSPPVLATGQTVKDVTLTLTQHGVITGTATDADGDPSQGLGVWVLRRGYVRGVPQFQIAATSPLDDRGVYRVAGLSPGDYYVGVIALPPQGAIPVAGLERYVNTFFSRAAALRDATKITVTPAREARGIDITTVKVRSYSVSGRVVASPTPAGMMLVAQDDLFPLDNIGGTQRLGEDGRFEFRGLYPGTCTIRNRSTDPKNPAIVVAHVTVVSHNITDLELKTIPSMTKGTLHVEGSDLQSLLLTSGFRVQLQIERDVTLRSSIQPDGTFQHAVPVPGIGRYIVEGLPGEMYVKSISFGDADVTHQAINFETVTPQPVQIILSTNAATVTGIAQGLGGIGGTTIALWPERENQAHITNGVNLTTTDQNGAFEFQSLHPGIYFLTAWEQGDQGVLANHEFISKFGEVALRLELKEASHIAAEAPLIPALAYEMEAAKLP